MPKLYLSNFRFICRLAIIIAFASLTNTGNTQPGILDYTFGNQGKVITTGFDTTTELHAMALQPDGKIVAVGNTSLKFVVARYKANGSLDSSFAKNGLFQSQVMRVVAKCQTVALQADGKILVGGYNGTTMDADFVIIRLNINGLLDSSFGTNGMVISNFAPHNNSGDQLYKLLIRPNGKILAGASISYIQNSNPTIHALGYIQYNSNGTIDSTHGIDGRVYVGRPNRKFYSSMHFQSDGKLVMAHGDQLKSFDIARFDTSGNLDSSFGVNGIVSPPIAAFGGTDFNMIIDTLDRILCTGGIDSLNDRWFGVFRFTPNGQFDNTFGAAGKVATNIGTKSDVASTVLVQSNGKIIVSGTYNWWGAGAKFASIRYNNNGSLDNDFGKHGILITDIPGVEETINTSLSQPDGKWIVGGKSGSRISGSALGNFTLVRYERDPRFKYNTIAGNVFLDKNKNGIKDSTEGPFNFAKVTTIKAGLDTVMTAVSNGRYVMDTDTGAYSTSVQSFSNYYNALPASVSSSFANYFNTDTVSFAMQPVPGKRDIAINIFPLIGARRGMPLQYKILYYNLGTDTVANGMVQLVLSKKVTFKYANPMPSQVVGDTIRWYYSQFKPLDTASILVNMVVKNQPTVNLGDPILSFVRILPTPGDLVPSNNGSEVYQIAVGSCDPNDKQEIHGGKIKTSQVAAGEYLQYTIRFQNTGTDTAFTVSIKDTLDSKVDWNSLRMIDASHNYHLTITDEKNCDWTFDNINLVDSNKNEPLSHGYITYIIKLKPGVVTGDVINNTAAIYFDFNLPVITNTQKTTVVTEVLPVRLIDFIARKEGQQNLLEWKTSQELNLERFEIERSNDGKDFYVLGVKQGGASVYTFMDAKPGKAFNYYRLRMVDKDGRYTYSLVKMINNTKPAIVTIYPNPVKNTLSLYFDNNQKQRLECSLISINGRVVMHQTLETNAGSSIKSINIETLQQGSYYLIVSTENKEVTVLKFEKL